MRHIISIALILWFCFGWQEVLLAQDIICHFNVLDTESGLSYSGQNYYVQHDNAGFVWISSPLGLNRFDGRGVKVYASDEHDPKALQNPRAPRSEMVERPNGDLLFCNGPAFIKYNRLNDDFTRIALTDEAGDTIPGNSFWNYLDTLTGNLWVAAGDAIYVTPVSSPGKSRKVIDQRGVIKSRMARSDNGDSIRYYRIGSGVPFVEVYSFAGHSLEAEAYYHLYTDDGAQLNELYYRSDSVLYAGTETGLKRYDFYTREWYSLGGETKVKDIYTINPLEDGTLLIGTHREGLFRYDPKMDVYTGRLMDYNGKKLSVLRPVIDRVHIDEDQNIWISTANEGVLYANLKKMKFDLFFAGDAAKRVKYRGFAEQGNAIWALTFNGALKMTPNDTTFFALPISGIEVEETIFIKTDRLGRLWIGTLEWLFLYNERENKFVKADILPEPLKNLPGYIGFSQLPDGRLLFGTNENKMIIVDEDLRHSAWVNASFRSSYAMAVDDQYVVFSSSIGGLGILSFVDDTLKMDTTFSGLQMVNTILPSTTAGEYWVADIEGLYQLSVKGNQARLRKIQEVNGYKIRSMTVDQSGRLWFGTISGLLCFSPQTRTLSNYDLSDGIQGVNYSLNSAFTSSSGDVFLGGTNGFNRFSGGIAFPTIPPARPVISEIRINDSLEDLRIYSRDSVGNASLLTGIVLPYKKNNLSFSLSGLTYAAPEKASFRYRLLGSTNEGYRNLGQSDQLDLTNLAYGQYLLKIGAANADGEWSKEEHSLSIKIKPPWYQTTWAYLAYVFTMGLLFYLLYRWRLQEVTQKEQLKTSEANARRKTAETETSILRLQMNPHFIFNSLNSIDEYIMIEEDVMRAHDYLVMFAELMRKILDMSEEPLTRLDREVEMIRGYVEAERMRVGEQLRLRVEQDDEVDMIFTWIPTMILQPFVENAIWHGIGDREQGGTVTLRFALQESDELLRVEVEDDGRGRGNAGGRTKEHTSKALEITRKRMELLNNKTLLAHQASNAPAAAPPNAHFEIEDLKKTDGTAAGTRVVLYLPLIYPDYDTSSSD